MILWSYIFPNRTLNFFFKKNFLLTWLSRMEDKIKIQWARCTKTRLIHKRQDTYESNLPYMYAIHSNLYLISYTLS